MQKVCEDTYQAGTSGESAYTVVCAESFSTLGTYVCPSEQLLGVSRHSGYV